MKNHLRWIFAIGLVGLSTTGSIYANPREAPMTSAEQSAVIGKGWAKNSINANILRHNSVVSRDSSQYVAYYAADAHIVLAKRELGSQEWVTKKTRFKGNVKDAHNAISIMVDGEGYLHMSWDHHNHPLRYCRSKAPGSLDMTDKMPMTGKKEGKVTYPEFYRLPNGDLLFLYRDGASGRGNLMLNHYDVKTQTWTQRSDAFINGEGRRSPYWQMCVDLKGTIHISWVWRETGDVATNHDMGYAKSEDGGKTWLKSSGEKYSRAITAKTAEYAARIPQRHELINTTGMCADRLGRPYIVTYFRPKGSRIPQYHLIHHDGSTWHTTQISDRKTPFSLSGGGTRRIPIARPRIVADSTGPTTKAYVLFRDIERGDRVSVARCDDLSQAKWTFEDLTENSVGMWEPSFDTEMWAKSKTLHIYLQKVGQGDGESTEDLAPSPISILEWKPE
jgi:hypothetical protein